MKSNLGIYRKTFLSGLAPDPILTVSEWADKHRYLSQEAASEPGPWRTSRTPYLKEIMDCLSPSSPATQIVFMKGSQVGGSESGNNWIGYVIDAAPGPMMVVQPTLGLAEDYSKQRIKTLIDACPRLKGKVKEARSRDAGNTVLAKEFPGGVLYLGGANSAASLASKPIKYLFLDEVDRYPVDVQGEGDPINLVKARTRTFTRKKIFINSTPTLDGRSRIQAEFNASDQRYFQLPCPHCGHFQRLAWERLRWPKGEPEKVAYVCEGCEKEIDERHKTAMLEAGQWVKTNPSSNVPGFHISALYSPLGWYGWKEIALDFLKAKSNPVKLKSFVNTVLGEVWKSKGDAPEWKRLYDRREDYPFSKVPAQAIFLTAGVDVQRDRIEIEIVGWGKGMRSWSIDYRVIPGDTSTEIPWKALNLVLNEKFTHARGAELSISLLAVDSGFNTQEVYKWVRSHPVNRVIAVKGNDNQPVAIGQGTAVDVTLKGKKIRRGLRVWPVGTGVVKTELYGWLKLEKPIDGEPFPPGFCHFPLYGEEYFKQLTAEQIVRRIAKGFSHYGWEKTRERNEALDCRTYARAAASLIGMDRFRDEHWDALALQIGTQNDQESSVVITSTSSTPDPSEESD